MISIIIPIYGVEKYIRQCIDSVISSHYSELEVILVDDGSKDNSGTICDEYSNKDSRIKVIHKENGGLVSARQAGLVRATGKYIGFVDGDDWIEPDMYSEVAEIIKKYEPDMVVTEFYSDYENKQIESNQIFAEELYNKETLKQSIYPKMLFAGTYYHFGVNPNCWSKIFKKEILEDNLKKVDKRIKMGEDAAFTYPCLLDAETVCYINKPLYHYRILQSSMSRGYDNTLENIITLPFYRLKEKNEVSDFDISEQLNYYLIYLANFLIRNEAKALGIKQKTDIQKTLANLSENKDVHKASVKINTAILPLHTKIIVSLLRKKCRFGLYIYICLLKKYLVKG